ncbi:MAG TPA: hypothetical protein VF132_11415 [Rudaea sp.]
MAMKRRGRVAILAGAALLAVQLIATPHAFAVFACTASPDAQQTARDEAFGRVDEALRSALRTSPEARDRALAALMETAPGSASSEPSARAAADAAPDDLLVQWIALHVAQRASGDDEPMLSRLTRYDSRNAAIWLEVLVRSAFLQDDAAVNDALDRMARSDHFDSRHAALSGALAQAYERYGSPSAPVGDSSASTEYLSNRLATLDPFVAPVFAPLIAACRAEPTGHRSAHRARDCEAVARLLAREGEFANVLSTCD